MGPRRAVMLRVIVGMWCGAGKVNVADALKVSRREVAMLLQDEFG